MQGTQKLIEFVRRHRCLYDNSDEHYKNYTKKCMLWEEIAGELNQSSEAVKLRWKNLRDGYTKYKKLVGAGGKRRYHKWIWGPNLKFLDSCVQNLVPSIAMDQSSPNSESQPSSLKSAQKCSGLAQQNSYLDPLQQPIESLDPLQHPVETVIKKSPERPSVSSPLPDLSSPPPKKAKPTPSKKTKESNGDVEKVIEFLKNRRKTDSVDLLFMSYAETFKRLNLMSQASLKVKLAKMFAAAEMAEISGGQMSPDENDSQSDYFINIKTEMVENEQKDPEEQPSTTNFLATL